MWVYVLIGVKPAGWSTWRTVTQHLFFFGHYKYDQCQSLHDGSTHWALPTHTTLSDLGCISSYSSVKKFTWIFFCLFFSDYIVTLYYCCLHQVDYEFITIFDFHTRAKGATWHSFSFGKKLTLAFFGHLWSKIFQILQDHNLVWGLHFHSPWVGSCGRRN